MKCENCNKEHAGTFGSGRFCSMLCARAFSTKANRQEINKKVSLKLTGKKQPFFVHSKKSDKQSKVFFPICNNCGERFTSQIFKTTCSIECRDAIRSKNGTLKMRITFFNIYQNENVVLQSKWEEHIANWLTDRKLRWSRPTKPMKWFDTTLNKNRTYIPDFLLLDFGIYLDVKNQFKQDTDADKLRQLKQLIPLLVGDKTTLKEMVAREIGVEPT